MIEMKGNLIRLDNNDEYNIKLIIAKKNLAENLSNFPSIFKIDDMIMKTLNVMKNILDSLDGKSTQSLLDELALEEYFFDKINRIFKKKDEKILLTVMQIISGYQVTHLEQSIFGDYDEM
ncbi:hypothetical protein RclHR1_01850010 [Rhizophagus clarus]|uniref:Uncharacterized protein n=1 Tax=Rhizophagus clarus TaxID=94130 RepID=A0A2Z6QML9_9GLOM|nr:hypothetical protein RclHR1_01850010 [Rhizophagus clarus]